MNRDAMPHLLKQLRAAALTALLLTLPACGTGPAAPPEQPPLFGASIGGPFTLTDKHGKTVRWADFNGRYRIIYFGYAYCPDICPTDVQRMMQGYAKFAAQNAALGDDIQPIFITIDPERDTPAVVGEFTSAFSDKLLGLTGTAAQVKEAADNFRVFYSRGETSDGGGYLMDHSNIAYLFGPQGEPIATLPTDLGADAVASELEKWVQ